MGRPQEEVEEAAQGKRATGESQTHAGTQHESSDESMSGQ